MALGAFSPLPIRLGGSDEGGWSSLKHARMCADLVALKRSVPLAVFTYSKSGSTVTIQSYLGANGAGVAYAPDTITVLGTGAVTFEWSDRAFTDPYDITYPINVRHGRATVHGATQARATVTTFANGATVRSFNSPSTAADATVTVVLS